MIHITDFLNDLYYYMEQERGRLVFEYRYGVPLAGKRGLFP